MLTHYIELLCWHIILSCSVDILYSVAVLTHHTQLLCWHIILSCCVDTLYSVAMSMHHTQLLCWHIILSCYVDASYSNAMLTHHTPLLRWWDEHCFHLWLIVALKKQNYTVIFLSHNMPFILLFLYFDLFYFDALKLLLMTVYIPWFSDYRYIFLSQISLLYFIVSSTLCVNQNLTSRLGMHSFPKNNYNEL